MYCAWFMYEYYSNRLPLIFNGFFMSINKVYQYQTRLASKISYYLPKARTNYGKFNIRFSGVKVWNSIEDSLKSKSRTCFKILLKESLISNYWLVHWCTFIFQFLLCTSPCLLLFVCACVCVNGNCVHCSMFSKRISKFLSAWPSHLARLALLFLSGCVLFFCYFFYLLYLSTVSTV